MPNTLPQPPEPTPAPPTLGLAGATAAIGGLWLLALHSAPWPAVALGALPAVLLLTSGAGLLFFDRDPRITQVMAGGAFLGLIAAPFIAIWLGAAVAGGLFLLALAAFLAAGYLGPARESRDADTPAPAVKASTMAESATDELVVNLVVFSAWPPPLGRSRMAGIGREIGQGLALFSDRGWLQRPAEYHCRPPPPDNPAFTARRVPQRFESMRFASDYEPWPDEPGRQRWLDYRSNRGAYVRLLRHGGDSPRDWAIFIHGIKMGAAAALDFLFLRPGLLHRQWGLNIACPILPLHGPRCFGGNSGGRAVNGDFVDTLHLVAQAVWDIRRLLAWIRAEHGGRVGVVGYSLGGYIAAVLAGLVDAGELDWLVAGCPAVDLVDLMLRFTPGAIQSNARAAGWDPDAGRRLLTPAAPLALAPQLPRERLGLFAGTADRITPPTAVGPLWRHWGQPQLAWHDGGHLRFLRAAASVELLRSKLALPPAAVVG